MTVDKLRELWKAQPFQKFTIHLADGRDISVAHREFLMLSPSGRTAYVSQPDDSLMAYTEPVLLKRIDPDPAKRKLHWYDDYVATGGYAALRKALEMKPDEIIKTVTDSGLRGRGGAGFSAGQKWSFIPKEKKGPHYLAVNADESEPGTFKDRYLIDYDPHSMLEGIAIASIATQCDVAYIYIRGEYHRQAKVLEHAIKEAYDHGVFGQQGIFGSKYKLECYVHRGAGAYICGEETGLLEALEGKRGWPRNKPPFPAIAGAFARPTVINNVETLCCVPPIIERGPAWFKSMGTHSPGPKLYGMSGHVNKPGVYEDELGITLDYAINTLAGGMKGGKYKGTASAAEFPWASSAPTSSTSSSISTMSASAADAWASAPPA
jgi:NADH-quinone oxidoreductase subunit F